MPQKREIIFDDHASRSKQSVKLHSMGAWNAQTSFPKRRLTNVPSMNYYIS